jgi:hypothetical protein
VLLPTFHDQLIAPVELAVLSLSPAAVEGPDLYSTSIEHRAPADVLIATMAVLLRVTVAVRAVTLTDSLLAGVAVGLAVGRAVALGFVISFGEADGFFVAGALGADDETKTVGLGAGVEPSRLAWSVNPNAGAGGVGAGPPVEPPRPDPTIAARITTTTRTPTHARMPQVVGAPAAVGAAVAATGVADRPGLDSDV